MNFNIVTTAELISELERRQREQPGQWCGRDHLRVLELAKRLNPLPLDAPARVTQALHTLEHYGYW